MVLASCIGPDPDVAPAPTFVLDDAHAGTHRAEEELVWPDALGHHLHLEGRAGLNTPDLEPDRLACLIVERADGIERPTVGGDDLVTDQQARALGRATMVDGSEEYPPLQRTRHHADSCVSHLSFREELLQARGKLVAGEDIEQLVVGELARQIVLGMGGTQVVQHRVERCGDLLARGIRWQGRSVRGAGLGPDPLDDPSIVEVLGNEAGDLLDERRSGGKGIDLAEGAAGEPQHAERQDHHQEDGMAQPSERSHGDTPRWLTARSRWVIATCRYARSSGGVDLCEPH
jgi:hypothetical protein